MKLAALLSVVLLTGCGGGGTPRTVVQMRTLQDGEVCLALTDPDGSCPVEDIYRAPRAFEDCLVPLYRGLCPVSEMVHALPTPRHGGAS